MDSQNPNRDYALLLFERQKRDRFRRLKARIRARLLKGGRVPLYSTIKPSTNLDQLVGFHKHYLNDLLCACAPENGFAQDAIEHSILTGQVPLSGEYDLERDVETVMTRYDAIITNYRNSIQESARAA